MPRITPTTASANHIRKRDTGMASASPAAATMSGEGVSPAARAAATGSPPGSAAATDSAEAGRLRGSGARQRRMTRSTAGSMSFTSVPAGGVTLAPRVFERPLSGEDLIEQQPEA